MPVIEFGLMGVKPNHKVIDPSTPEGEILNKAWNAVTTAPGGPHWAYGGLEINDPSRLWGFFEFDSLEHHKEFAKTSGAEAVKDLPVILTHSEFQKHITVEGDMPSVLRSPATSVTLVYLPPDISATRKNEVSTLALQFIHEKLNTCADVKAMSFGWSVENDFPVLGDEERDGKPSTVFAVFVGWSSVDTLKTFREGHGNRGGFEKISEMEWVTHSVTRLIQCREFGSS